MRRHPERRPWVSPSSVTSMSRRRLVICRGRPYFFIPVLCAGESSRAAGPRCVCIVDGHELRDSRVQNHRRGGMEVGMERRERQDKLLRNPPQSQDRPRWLSLDQLRGGSDPIGVTTRREVPFGSRSTPNARRYGPADVSGAYRRRRCIVTVGWLLRWDGNQRAKEEGTKKQPTLSQ